MNLQPDKPVLGKWNSLFFMFIVLVGYVVTSAFNYLNRRRLSDEELILGILIGVIYLLLALNNSVIFNHLPAGWAAVFFFSVECSLVFLIGLQHGVGGNFLIGIPLIVIAVERLKPWQCLLVYAALGVAVVLPLGLRYETWLSTLINGVSFSIYILFLAMFVNLRLKEQQARERAERLMLELEQANVQLAAYATQAEELAMTQERNRLAREIHDNLGHYLTIVNVQIEAAKLLMNSEPTRALDALDKAQELAKKGLTRVRESVAALRESPVSNRPLSQAIASLVKETQRSGIVTKFKVAGNPQTLENKVALALYQTAQEGLTNVCKHARASRVDVLLDFQPSQVCLEVRDNGVGAADTTGGFGLLGIRERIQLLGGRVEVRTGEGKGFCLLVKVPLSYAESPESVRIEQS